MSAVLSSNPAKQENNVEKYPPKANESPTPYLKVLPFPLIYAAFTIHPAPPSLCYAALTPHSPKVYMYKNRSVDEEVTRNSKENYDRPGNYDDMCATHLSSPTSISSTQPPPQPIPLPLLALILLLTLLPALILPQPARERAQFPLEATHHTPSPILRQRPTTTTPRPGNATPTLTRTIPTPE